jgi:hypothetical protein
MAGYPSRNDPGIRSTAGKAAIKKRPAPWIVPDRTR